MEWQYYLDLVAEDRLSLLALPIFLLVIVLEKWYDHRNELKLYNTRDLFASLGMLIITGMVEFIPKVLAFIAIVHLHAISPLADIVGRQWWAWFILIFLDDLSYYAFHRANHEVRLFWAGHVSHHSSIHMNFGTALRQGAGERIHKYFFWLWLPLLGFDVMMIFTVMSINLIYQFWVHTELVYKLPRPIEFIFNTPSHHRVHHASNIRYLDCNHAGMFIIWDRLFGTFSEELSEEKPIYGLTENIETYNPAIVASHEYLSLFKDVWRAPGLINKLKYIFFAPGWSHDNEDKRAKTLRKKLKLA